MSEEFESPNAFLEYLKIRHSKPIMPGEGDTGEFMSLTIGELARYAPEFSSSTGHLSGHGSVIESLVSSIHSSLSDRVSSRIRSCIAVGVLNCGEANAHLFKSLDNKYAIVITRGMMNLLHKYNKFLLGRVPQRSSRTRCLAWTTRSYSMCTFSGVRAGAP